ncbi:MAG: leucine-rich repeat protein [Oscillospiraceae bacterium]|nr:leucine-rich repeat protein [Oscillospiraceae bacterium]
MKKRNIITALTAVMTGISAAALPLAAELPTALVAEAASTVTGTTADGFRYSYQSGSSKAKIIGYTGTATSITIPSKVAGKTVTEIGDEAFSYLDDHNVRRGLNITSVTFPNTVKTIGEYAFCKCPLTSLTLPANVTAIKGSAFSSCYELTSVNVQGAAALYSSAFAACTKLRNVRLNAGCTRAQGAAHIFNSCTSLVNLNGNPVVRNSTDENGNPMPVLSVSSTTAGLIRTFFTDTSKVKFIDTYCSAICKYVVDTETRSWMSETVKARQLHDWLVRHCEYEDGYGWNGTGTETLGDENNHIYSSVFLSYGLNERGSGVGETVCEGFSKAYTMLLNQAGIESYVLSAGLTPIGRQQYPDQTISGHAWNLVKADGKYYQCDITADDCAAWQTGATGSYNTIYTCFLKNRAVMETLHSNAQGLLFTAPTIPVIYTPEHPLLNYNKAQGDAALNQCIYTLNDTNADGILDNDWDFNGTVNQQDTRIRQNLVSMYGGNITQSWWLRTRILTT